VSTRAKKDQQAKSKIPKRKNLRMGAPNFVLEGQRAAHPSGEKHCRGELCLDNAFSLIEGHRRMANGSNVPRSNTAAGQRLGVKLTLNAQPLKNQTPMGATPKFGDRAAIAPRYFSRKFLCRGSLMLLLGRRH
jgi:hypothetical protein